MRERNHHGPSTHSVGGRLLAFLLVFSMMLGVCPAALADATSTSIKVYNSTSNTPICQDTGDTADVKTGSISTGEAMTIQLTYGAADGDEGVEKKYTAKLYLGNMDKEILTYFSGGGKKVGVERTVDGVKYTVCQDATTGEYYLEITGITMMSGGTLSVPISAYFTNAAPNGTAWNLKLELSYADDTAVLASREVTVTASATASMKNTKTALTDRVTLTTLTDQEKIESDLSFRITAYSGTSLDTSISALENGEAAIESYTVNDTLTLPDGMYFDVSATGDEAIKTALSAMFTSSSGTVTVTEYGTDSNGKINSVTLAHTETSDDTTKQIQDYVGTITLTGSSIVVAAGTGNSNITNSVQTSFTTVGSTAAEQTEQATATVQVMRPTEGGFSDMSKTIEDVADLYGTYNTWDGYVVTGDYVLYKVSFKNSGQIALTDVKITDALPEGVEGVTDLIELNDKYKEYFSSYDNQSKEWSAVAWSDSVIGTYDASSNTYTFSGITVDPGTTFTAHILVKVSELGENETSRQIINTAKIGKEGIPETVDLSAPPITQKEPTPELQISKWVVKTDSSGNDTGSIYAYSDGDTIKYYITVSNTGAAAAENVSIVDKFPVDQVELDYSKVTVSYDVGVKIGTDSTTADEPSLSWSDITIPAGGKVTIAIPGTVRSNEDPDNTNEEKPSIVNTASETYNGQTKTATSTLVSQSEAKETNPAATVSISKAITNGATYVKEGDIVSYRIAVISPDYAFGGEYTDVHTPLVIYDSLPDWLELQTSTVKSSASVTGEITSVTAEVEGNRIKFNLSTPYAGSWRIYYIDFDCKVTANINNYPDGTVFYNTAEIDGGASAQSDKITTGEEPATSTTSSTDLKVEKTAYVERNGEKVYLTKDSVINDGEAINFEIKITNVGEEAVTEFRLYDDLHGVYEKGSGFYVYPFNSEGNQLSLNHNYRNYIEIATWNSNIFANGSSAQYIEAISPIEIGFTNNSDNSTWVDYSTNYGGNMYCNADFSLAVGDYIVLKYALTPSENFSSGSNGAKVDDSGYSTVSYHKLSTLSINKTSAESKYVVTPSTAEGLNKVKIDYTVEIKNEKTVPYTSEGVYFVDELPEGAKLYGKGNVTIGGTALDSAKFYIGTEFQNTDWTEVTAADSAPSGQYLGVFFGDSVTIPANGSILLNYSITLDQTSEEYAELLTALGNDGAFEPRQLINNVYFHGDTSFIYQKSENVSVEANDMTTNNTVELAPCLVHPGIEKVGYAYIAGAAASTVTESKDKALPGAYLIWKIKVQNGGTSGDKTMSSYTVVDTLPAGYTYRDGNSFDGTNGAKYPSGLTDTNYKTGKIIKHNSNGTVSQLDYIKPTPSGQTLTWNFTGDYALAPGEYLEYTIITYPEDENNVTSGIYYNSAKVEVADPVYEETISAGKYNDNGAISGDSFALNSVATTGEKTVSPVGEVGSDGIVTYTLSVKNDGTGEQNLENLTLIDRLPYVGDTAVLTADERGSTAEAQLLDEPTVKIGDTTLTKDTNYTLGYSGVTGKVFSEHDADWDGVNGQLLWSPNYAASTKLIRIALADGVKVAPGEILTVTFRAKLTAEDVTVDSVAYNSFGYCYNSGSNTDMAAESIKTESTLTAEAQTTGSIKVKKVCANNKTLSEATPQIFYFAIFKSAYTEGAVPEQIQSITLMVPASGNPVNADVTFDNLYYPQTVGARQTYYIYETDANGVPLRQSTYTDYTMYEGFYRTDIESEIKTVDQIAAGNDYCYWTKDLAANKVTNSAIFSNLNLIEEAEYNIVGPFYADVPFDSASAAADQLTSTRTDQYGDKADDQASSVRGAEDNPYANDDAGTLYEGAYNGFGGTTHGHTIATGFFASFTPGDDSITSLTWNITTKATAENPVYVRAENGSTSLGSMEFEEGAVYTDGSDETGYSIFKVKEGTEKTLRITDSLPTISGDGTANIGIIIDQLYDRKATATLTFNDPATANIGAGNVGDVTARGTAVNQSQQIAGLTRINYEILLSDMQFYDTESWTPKPEGETDRWAGMPFKDSTIAELAANGIVFDSRTRYHNDHGTEYLYTIDIAAPGAVKITLGECFYGPATAELWDGGTLIDSAKINTVCYDKNSSTEGNGLVVLEYTGSAPKKLQVKFVNENGSYGWAYLPYLKVESITPTATAIPTAAPTDAPAATETPVETESPEPTAEPVIGAGLQTFDSFLYLIDAETNTTGSITETVSNTDKTISLIATSEKNLTIASRNDTVNLGSVNDDNTFTATGETKLFTSRIATGGSGNKTSRAIAVKVKAGQTLGVYAASSGAEVRTLKFEHSNGATGSGSVPSTSLNGIDVAKVSYNVTEDGTVYIYSTSSGIYIYGIDVTDPVTG
ncbi:MAG: hypothetical protein ACI38A_03305 [Candidatus Ornithomonoglobus sp.]